MTVKEDQIDVAGQKPPSPQPDGFLGKVAHYFKFAENRTNFRTETLAGVATFMTMAYILVVNPLILSDAIFLEEAGDLFTELAVATAVSAAIGTIAMALLANYPFALAPGMGINAFFAYTVVLGLGIDWRLALACVFVEGLIFIVLTITDIRRHLITAIPTTIKAATTVGIGLFLALIGLKGNPEIGGAGLIVPNEVTFVSFGNIAQPPTIMAIVGILLTAFFLARRIRGALLWGIVGTALLGWVFGIAAPPEAIVSLPAAPTHLFGAAFIGLSQFGEGSAWDFIAVLFVFLFVDMFDTIGTLAGVGTQAGYIDENGELPKANRALSADAIATTTGAIMGTSSVTTFVESAAGVAEGGRTGFTSLVVGALFLVSLIFTPIFAAIPGFATAPALLVVGVFMMASITTIQWQDITEALPAFLTIFFIPFGFSIAEGLALGLIVYPLMKTFAGKPQEVPIVTWILAVIFVARFVFMAVQFG